MMFFCAVYNVGMFTKKIIHDKTDLPKDAKRLYNDNFPRNERIPFSRLLNMLDDKRLMHAYFDGDVFVGLSYVFIMDDLVYLGYLVVEEELNCAAKITVL